MPEHGEPLGNRHQIAIGQAQAGGKARRLAELLEGLGVKIVVVDERHALAEVEPEPTIRDPFDRMLLAQCQVEGLKLVTIDRALVSHPLAAKG